MYEWESVLDQFLCGVNRGNCAVVLNVVATFLGYFNRGVRLVPSFRHVQYSLAYMNANTT